MIKPGLLFKKTVLSLASGLLLLGFASCSGSKLAQNTSYKHLDAVASAPLKTTKAAETETAPLPETAMNEAGINSAKAFTAPAAAVEMPAVEEQKTSIQAFASVTRTVIPNTNEVSIENLKTTTSVKQQKKEIKKYLRDQKANVSGFTLMIAGLILVIASIIIGVLGLGIIAYIFGTIGGILLLVGLIIWLLEILGG